MAGSYYNKLLTIDVSLLFSLFDALRVFVGLGLPPEPLLRSVWAKPAAIEGGREEFNATLSIVQR